MIKRAGTDKAGELAGLAVRMWPDHVPEDLAEEFRRLAMKDDADCFIRYVGDRPAAFAQCQLRRDYVEGTGSSPVGCLEGIFVLEGTDAGPDCGDRNVVRGCTAAALQQKTGQPRFFCGSGLPDFFRKRKRKRYS